MTRSGAGRDLSASAQAGVLVVFARAPVPGRTKTRLIPVLGPDGAAELHRAMVDRTLSTARTLRERWPCHLEVRLEGGPTEASRDWLGTDIGIVPQGEGSLGARMARVFADHFRAGAPRVVLIGTDVPGMTAGTLERAFRALEINDVVLGPATDGGYYLLALRRPAPQLFDGIVWGGPDVLAASLARAAANGLRAVCLEVLSDIDVPEDLPVWTSAQHHVPEHRRVNTDAAAQPATPVWIDTDPAVGLPDRDVDDGLALVQAFHSPELAIRGLSVVFGNAPLDLAWPIAETIVSRFGPRGLRVHGGAAAPDHDTETPASRALAEALAREPLTILALGPATNIAAVLKQQPELARQVRAVVAVAGRRPGQRFVTGATNPRSHRDFNFEQDPEAFGLLLDSGVPLALAPFEISSKVWLTEADVARLDEGGEAARWLAGPARRWLRLWHEVFGVDGFNPFDTLAVACVATPALVSSTELPIRIQMGPDDVTEDRMQGTRPLEKPYLEVSAAFAGEGRRARYFHDVDARFKEELIRRLQASVPAE